MTQAAMIDSMRARPAVPLVPDWGEPEEEREILGEFWPALFEAMLGAWLTDDGMWPSDRTRLMFDEWFDIETHSMIVDVYMDEAIDYTG